MIIDTHCHVGTVWYEPAEALLFQMDRCGVDRAVLVQMLGQFDNTYQQQSAKRWPDRFVSVVAVDPSTPLAVTTLRQLAAEGATGVRLRPNAQSPGADPLEIWRTAADLGLPISCVGTTAQFSATGFAELIGSLPQLKVVLEHLGGAARPDADSSIVQVWNLARFANVSLKLPGLGQLCKRMSPLPKQGSALDPEGAAVIRQALQAFSPARIMWGSDFPVVSSREGYANALQGVRAYLDFLSAAEQSDVFGATAARTFGIAP